MPPQTSDSNPINILLVLSEQDARDITQAILQDHGHTVFSANDCEELLGTLISFQPDMLIIDIDHLADEGLQLMQGIRSAEPDISIIACTANKRLEDRLTGYKHGADICLTKPIASEELSAIAASIARHLTHDAAGSGWLQLVPGRLELRGHQGVSGLSHYECSLLEAFARAERHRLDHHELMHLSGKPVGSFSKAALEVQIVRLRKKLEQVGASSPTIKAIRGNGYQLCVPIDVTGVAQGRVL